MANVRVRRDVWTLSAEDPWHPTILYYAKAVAALRKLDVGNFADPRSWRHLAETHGASVPRSAWPAGAHWDACQHGSWYFLPWHRMYLHHLEMIALKVIQELGGSDDWALPYWNYSDPARPQARGLPTAFKAATLPDGSPNPLLVIERASTMNAAGVMPAAVVSTSAALAEREFSDPQGGGVVPGFGGAELAPSHTGGIPGVLEQQPHNGVHGAVGGPRGWMSAFDTAARDPIFWLHHANIDRLWSAWLRIASHADPTDRTWLEQTFEFGSGSSHTKLAVRKVLDTRSAPLHYRYDDEPAVVTHVPRAAAAREAIVRRGPPEMIGASGRVGLGREPSHTEFAVNAPRAAGRAAHLGAAQPQRTYLKIENVRGSEYPATSYGVYVNAPADASGATLNEYLAGVISFFGVREATQKSDAHVGEGSTYALDITDLVSRLEAKGQWDPSKMRVTFAPIPDASGQVYPGDVEVGRVTLHRG